jgi:hypothetical protein
MQTVATIIANLKLDIAAAMISAQPGRRLSMVIRPGIGTKEIWDVVMEDVLTERGYSSDEVAAVMAEPDSNTRMLMFHNMLALEAETLSDEEIEKQVELVTETLTRPSSKYVRALRPIVGEPPIQWKTIVPIILERRGRSQKEIAYVMQRTGNTMKSRLFHAYSVAGSVGGAAVDDNEAAADNDDDEVVFVDVAPSPKRQRCEWTRMGAAIGEAIERRDAAEKRARLCMSSIKERIVCADHADTAEMDSLIAQYHEACQEEGRLVNLHFAAAAEVEVAKHSMREALHAHDLNRDFKVPRDACLEAHPYTTLCLRAMERSYGWLNVVCSDLRNEVEGMAEYYQQKQAELVDKIDTC